MPEDCPALPGYIYTIPPEASAIDHARRWPAHVDAGWIGAPLPVDPAIAANAARMTAIFSRGSGGGISSHT